MKQLRLPIFTSKIKIYNLRIVPACPVYDDSIDFKKQFETVYGKQPLSRSKPHITIATFKMNSKYFDFLIQAFSQLSSTKKFKLDIGGFGIIENSNELYLKVTKTEELEGVHKNVQTFYDDNLVGKLKSLKISDSPHITISKTTGNKMLYKSLAHFQKTAYSKQIEVDCLTIVSRSKYKTWDWDHQIKLS